MDKKDDFRAKTKKYALEVVIAYKELPKSSEEVRVIGKQMLRSGTSVGAQYREASRARSTADFVSKIESCAQEADETMFWIELLIEGCGAKTERLSWLHGESDELISILVTMAKNAKQRTEQ